MSPPGLSLYVLPPSNLASERTQTSLRPRPIADGASANSADEVDEHIHWACTVNGACEDSSRLIAKAWQDLREAIVKESVDARRIEDHVPYGTDLSRTLRCMWSDYCPLDLSIKLLEYRSGRSDLTPRINVSTVRSVLDPFPTRMNDEWAWSFVSSQVGRMPKYEAGLAESIAQVEQARNFSSCDER